jgi:hypothetical protein
MGPHKASDTEDTEKDKQPRGAGSNDDPFASLLDPLSPAVGIDPLLDLLGQLCQKAAMSIPYILLGQADRPYRDGR